MKILMSRTKTIAIAFVLMLTTATAFITCLPTAMAFQEPAAGYMYVGPNPIGLGQLGVVEAWVVPRPLLARQVYYNYTFTFTAPNGQKTSFKIPATEQTASVWFNYVLDQVGNWTVEFSWAGNVNRTATYTKSTWVCQQEAIPSWPAAPLPTEGWNWPINPENREWAQIGGAWFQGGYNRSDCAYNPYSQAPGSSHILWRLPPTSGIGGIQAGTYGAGKYFSSSSIGIDTVMAGRGYYTSGGNIYCIDIRTGQQLWSAKGSFNTGAYRGNLPVLYQFSSTRFVVYNGLTGAVTLNVTGMSSLGYVEEMAYDPTTGYKTMRQVVYSSWNYSASVYQKVNNVTKHGSGCRLIKWTLDGTTTNFANRIIYNVTWPFGIGYQTIFGSGDATILGDIIFQRENLWYGGRLGTSVPMIGALNATTGKMIWYRAPSPSDYPTGISTEGPSVGAAYGLFLMATSSWGGSKYMAFDMKTGDIEWMSPNTVYPWGCFWSYSQAAAYGLVYALTYGGAYAFNATNGDIVWHYSAGNSYGETPYGTWPIRNGPLVADGKLYAGTAEWGTPSPYYRGQKLHCIDAYEGTHIWSIMGSWSPNAIAEGYLFADNAYDGYSYCFGRGPTLTEVSTDASRIAKGESVWIRGRVTDQSPALAGTPAVSKESMSAWEQYLFMQQPKPTNTTGVPVNLIAVGSDNTVITIGTTTSNANGDFQLKWTPPKEDSYYVTASFYGDESYYSSWNLTSLTVGPAPVVPETPETPEYPVAPDYTLTIVGTGLAVILAVAVFGILLLRKRP